MSAEEQAPPPRIACVIPVFNHADTVGAVVERTLALGHRTIVVDDGSTDGTADVLSGIPEAHVIRHPQNEGKGASLISGFREASRKAEYAVTLDADGQHNPEDAANLIAALPRRGRAIVVGHRVGMDGEHTPWTSRFGRKFSNFWVWAGGGARIADSQSGFRLYPLAETLALRPRSRRFQFEVEILVLAGWSRLPVVNAPVSVLYPEERISHFRPFVDFWRNSFTFSRLITQRILIPRRWRARRITG
ncbi:MAG: glycosyltransferase family 2 protein [bacterium]